MFEFIVNVSLGSNRFNNMETGFQLKSLEVFNFKSFKEKHYIGPFTETFTAIVGPNGGGESARFIINLNFYLGKSSIVDAIMFGFACPVQALDYRHLIHKENGERHDEVNRDMYNHYLS